MTNEKSYAIIGLGRFGMPLAKKLAEAGKEVIGIDRDEDRVKELREYTESVSYTHLELSSEKREVYTYK